MMQHSSLGITGVILAGGQARRMNGVDKGLVNLINQPLYQWVADRLTPQVNYLLINANRNLPIYQRSGYQIIPDSLPGFQGPLAGMLSGLQASPTDWVVFTPCDMPLIPNNLVNLLWRNKQSHYLSYFADQQHEYPTLCLMHKQQLAPLVRYLQRGRRRLRDFLLQQHAELVFSPELTCHLHNINTPMDCQRLANEFITL